MTASWTICGRAGGCTAARLGDGPACLNHLDHYEFEAVLEQVGPGVQLDLRGVVVKAGEQRLTRVFTRMKDADGRLVRIGGVLCEAATFNGVAPFGGMEILACASFKGVRFEAEAVFEQTRFEGGADFSSAVFVGPAKFSGAQFGKPLDGASLAQATGPNKCALFKGAVFGVATFAHACFWGDASFESANVGAELAMAPTYIVGKLALNGLRAAGQVDVQANADGVQCADAEFSGRVRLQLQAGAELSLTDTVFDQPAIVESWLPSASHRGTDDPPVGDLIASGRSRQRADDPLVMVRSLRGVDAEHLTLVDVDLSQCLIFGLSRPEELRLEGRWRLAPTPRGWHLRWGWLPWQWTYRQALYEEHLWRSQHEPTTRGWARPDPGCSGNPVPGPQRLVVLYRQLRRSVEDALNEPGAADLYYGEMEMRRLSTERRDERWLLTVYWLVSGYGLRASRSMMVLAALVLACALALQKAGFPGHTPGYIDCLLYASGSVLSLDLTGHLPAVLSDWGQLVRMILRVGGPVLLGLGALAVRGRLKR